MSAPEDSTCPSVDAFVMLQEGALSDHERAELMEHIDGCPRCTELLAALAELEPDPREEEPSPPSRQMIGRYELLEEAGVGGMGVVYKTRDTHLDRLVAVKVLRPDLIFSQPEDMAEARERLKREAAALAALDHPNIVTVYDIGVHDEHLFMACAFIQGINLREWLAREELSWRQKVALFLDVAAALTAAHEVGIVHRDVKPENILVREDGRPMLTDFGLASPPPSNTSIDVSELGFSTRTNTILGTPAYMSPEQLDGQPPKPSSDQFSLCVTLYEALYGFRPFQASTLLELSQLLKSGQVIQPSTRQIPDRLFEVLRVGLSPIPSERHHDMQALADALASTLEPKPKRKVSAALQSPGKLIAAILVAVCVTGAVIRFGASEGSDALGDEAARSNVSAQVEVTPDRATTRPAPVIDQPPAREESSEQAEEVKVTDTSDTPTAPPERDQPRTTPEQAREPSPTEAPVRAASARSAPSRGQRANAPSSSEELALSHAFNELDGERSLALLATLEKRYPDWRPEHPEQITYIRTRAALMAGDCSMVTKLDEATLDPTTKRTPSARSQDRLLYSHQSCLRGDSERFHQLGLRARHTCEARMRRSKEACSEAISAFDDAIFAVSDRGDWSLQLEDTLTDHSSIALFPHIKTCEAALKHERARIWIQHRRAVMPQLDDLPYIRADLFSLCKTPAATFRREGERIYPSMLHGLFLLNVYLHYVSSLRDRGTGAASEAQLVGELLDRIGRNYARVSDHTRRFQSIGELIEDVLEKQPPKRCEATTKLWRRATPLIFAGTKPSEDDLDQRERDVFPACVSARKKQNDHSPTGEKKDTVSE